MSEHANDQLSEKLFQLCEQQLLAIIADADVSINRIVDCTSTAVNESAELYSKIERGSGLDGEELALCADLHEKVSEILERMQCFDELSQRIQHIKEIVLLIKIESAREGFLSDPESSRELFKDISGIFSIRSEFEVLEKVFPETRKIDVSNMVELF
jgi:dsDNA-specific endonuclease/ATPase MutS2